LTAPCEAGKECKEYGERRIEEEVDIEEMGRPLL